MALITKKLSGFDKLKPTEIDNTTKIVALSGQSPNNKNILLSDLIEDTLTSTNEYAALSAKQGKTLKSLIDNMEVAPSENVFNTNLYVLDTVGFNNGQLWTDNYKFLITPGSYGVYFTTAPLMTLLPGKQNFTLEVEYASFTNTGSNTGTDYIHTLIDADTGRSYVRKVYHTSTGLVCSAFTQISGGGVTGTSGTNGRDGTDTEFIYKMMNSNTSISAPGTSQTDNFLPEGWSYNLSSVNSNLRYGFMSKRKKVNNSWSGFSVPAIVSNFAENGLNGINGTTGHDGSDGIDGTDIEFIFKTTPTYSAPTTPLTSQINDYVPSGWTDDMSGVDSINIYEWVSKRTKNSSGVWSNFSTPALWAKYSASGSGDQGLPGEAGKDGRDYEFIFTRTETLTQPETPSSMNTDDFVPAGWTDNMQGVDVVYKYEWASKRYKDTSWSVFSTPVVWAIFGKDGENGKNGQDGKGIEFIFKLTTTNTAPQRPTSVNTVDYVPSGWTDDMSGVDAINKYEWACVRTKSGDTWSEFSYPALWAMYSKNGIDGINAASVLLSKNIVNVSCLASGEARTGNIPTDIYVHAYDGASLATISSYSMSISSGIANATYSDQSKGVGKITINSLSSDYAEITLIVNVYMESLGASVAIEKIIPIIKIKDGYAGPYIIARGAYNPDTTYYGSPVRADVVSVTIMGTTQWYITKSNSGSFSGIQPQVTGGWETKWDVMPSFEMIATGMLFAENANIAEFIFNGGKLKSQYPLGSQQQNLNNGKNLELDGVNGTIKLSTVNGDLEINKEGIFLNDENGLNKVSIFNGDIPEITDDYEYGLTPPVVVTTGALSQRSGTFVGSLQFDVPNSTFVCDKNVNKIEIRIAGYSTFSGSNSPVSVLIQVYNSATDAFVKQIAASALGSSINLSTYNLPIGTYKLKVLFLHPNSETITYTYYLQSGTITYQNIALGTMIGNNGISYSAAADGFFSVRKEAVGAMNLTARGNINLKGDVHIVGNIDLDGYVKINKQAQ